MSRRRSAAALTTVVLALLVALLGSGPAAADWQLPCMGTDTPVAGATLLVDGVAPTPGVGNFMVAVCRNQQNSVYGFMIGKLTGQNTVSEDAGVDAIGHVFTLDFDMAAGEHPDNAELYGDVESYTVTGTHVHLVARTAALTQVNFGGSSPFASCTGGGSTGTYLDGSTVLPCSGISCANPVTTACVDDVGTLHGGVRFTTGRAALTTGMYVGAAANNYGVGLAGCAGVSYGGTGTGGAAPDPTLSVSMNGPHWKADGTTPNSGSIVAFIPDTVLQTCVGGDAAAAKSALTVSRAEGSTVTPVGGTEYTATAEATGIRIVVPTLHFSRPSYRIRFITVKAPVHVGWAVTARTITVHASAVRGLRYALSARASHVTRAGSCLVRRGAVTCTVRVTSRGTWAMTFRALRGTLRGHPVTRSIRIAR